MTDPDVPSRQNTSNREIINWLVVNIPGIKLSKGQTLANYRGPTPLKGTGLHRNVFLVYKQLGIISGITLNDTSVTSHQMRIPFNTKVFAKTYRLGQPIAANFYVSQFDEYVALLRKQIQNKINDKPKSGLSPRRAKLLDWAPRKPKTPKFPQMVCINYLKYQEIQKLLHT